MPKLKRRDVVLIPVLAAGAYAGGHFSEKLAPKPAQRPPSGTIGYIDIDDAVLASLRRTVSPEVQKHQMGEFVTLAKQKFSWVFHPLTALEVFDRKLCTEFLINSNLIGNGFMISAYEFVEYPGVCNPFEYAV